MHIRQNYCWFTQKKSPAIDSFAHRRITIQNHHGDLIGISSGFSLTLGHIKKCHSFSMCFNMLFFSNLPRFQAWFFWIWMAGSMLIYWHWPFFGRFSAGMNHYSAQDEPWQVFIICEQATDSTAMLDYQIWWYTCYTIHRNGNELKPSRPRFRSDEHQHQVFCCQQKVTRDFFPPQILIQTWNN